MSKKQVTHEQNHELIKQNFEAQEAVMQKIMKQGARPYFESLPELGKAFRPHDRWIKCIDDRTPGGFHSAGSGILRPLDEVLASFKKARVAGITSHDGCGAAALYAKQNNLPGNTDEYGREWAKKIADLLDVTYENIEVDKPHNARVCYYDNTARFNYKEVDGLLPGFIISRGIQSEAVSINEAGISTTIATGDHGFGKLITEQKPFLFLIIAKSEKELEDLKNELAPVQTKFGRQVKIDGFIAPKYE